MTNLENPPFQGSISHQKNGWIFQPIKKRDGRFLWIAPVKSHGWIQGDFQFPVGWKNSRVCCFCWWLNQPPLTNGFIFPKVRAENKKRFELPPPRNHGNVSLKQSPVLLFFLKKKTTLFFNFKKIFGSTKFACWKWHVPFLDLFFQASTGQKSIYHNFQHIDSWASPTCPEALHPSQGLPGPEPKLTTRFGCV